MKITEGNSFDFMPISISKDSILFSRYKRDKYYFTLIKITDGKEEVVADNIIFKDQFYGNIQTQTSMDILYNDSKLNFMESKRAKKEDMNALKL